MGGGRQASVELRNGSVEDPLGVALAFLAAYREPAGDVSSRLGEADLRLANRGGARISAAEVAGILERRRAIERALRGIAPDASLAGPSASVPWTALGQLFAAFADVRGVGFAKATKTLHPKRPALIPLLDSLVQKHLAADDPGPQVPFAERGVALVRGYKRDLDRNRTALRILRRELAKRGHDLTEVRILDLLIWSAEAGRG